MKETHQISAQTLEISDIYEIVKYRKKLVLSQEAEKLIDKARDYLDEKVRASEQAYYGINTGFGSLCNVKISAEKLAQLQHNLVMSHACGTGERVASGIVQLMLLLKVQSLSYGHSGIAKTTVQRLMDFYNEGVYPVIYEQGSLGASGDLAPLAHLALPLFGEGEVEFKGEVLPAAKILEKFNWEPLKLRSKEGLALLNGTQFMSANAVHVLLESHKLSFLADVIGAVSIDAYDAGIAPFNALVHNVRPHQGQVETAENIRRFLKGSELIEREKQHVQDPYSFRCIPQVHGASKDSIRFVHGTVKTEINGVTDNPNIFVDEDRIISGGNFHGQPLALAMDYLGIALSELANISERRIFQLVSGLRGLPMFLVDDPGLNNGLMIPQYTAASIVSQNKQLSTPASVDSVVSSNGQEDHVSMGANAATKLLKIQKNLKTVLAIELLNASQALYFREPLKSSEFIEGFITEFRKEVPIIKQDKILAPEIEKAKAFIDQFDIDKKILMY